MWKNPLANSFVNVKLRDVFNSILKCNKEKNMNKAKILGGKTSPPAGPPFLPHTPSFIDVVLEVLSICVSRVLHLNLICECENEHLSDLRLSWRSKHSNKSKISTKFQFQIKWKFVF